MIPKHALFRLLGVALALACVARSSAFAQSSRVAMSVASARARAEAEDQARQTVRALFERLCPGRCELLRVEATTGRPRSIAALEPGFEDDAPQAFDSSVETLQVEILLDATLPAGFRQNMPRMIRYQLQSLAGTVEVRTESLAFPEPQLEPAPPVVREPPIPAMRPPAMSAPEPASAGAVEPQGDRAREVQGEPGDLWARAVPWIGGVIIALILAALILLLLWRLTQRDERVASVPKDAPSPAPRPTDADLEPRVRAFLDEQRGASNAALRRWLTEDPERVAGFVQIFGVDAVRDLRGADELEVAFERLGRALIGHPEPPSGEVRRTLASEAIARFSAAELAQTRGPGWDFLDTLSTSQLETLLGELSPDERALVLAETSPRSRIQLLASLEPAQRGELLLASAEDLAMPLAERRRLRLRLRARAAEVSAETGRDADGARFAVDLLCSADAHEQVALARRVTSHQPARAHALLERVLLERAIAVLPEGALADALTRVPLDALVEFLRGTDSGTRSALLEQMPARLRPAVTAELEIGGAPVSRTRFLVVRAAVLESAERVLRRDGVAVASVNARVLAPVGSEDVIRKEAAE